MSTKSVVQPSKSGNPTSRRSKRIERITKAERRWIVDSSGNTRKVDLVPGDIVTTITTGDGRKIQNVRHKDTTRDYSVSRTQNTAQKSTKVNTTKRQVRSKKSSKTSYQIPNNDLAFIDQYVEAFLSNDQERKNAFNEALAKKPNKELLWKGIWRRIDPNNTPERSAAQHEMLYTQNGMGQTNWYNMFGGNAYLGEQEDSLNYVSPEQRARTIQLTTNPTYTIPVEQSVTTPDLKTLVKSIIQKYFS